MGMKNPATLPQGERNEFTNLIVANQKDNWTTHVRLRNGMVVTPVFKQAASEHEGDCFYVGEWSMCWNVDGTSVTNPRLDMMEIVDATITEEPGQ